MFKALTHIARILILLGVAAAAAFPAAAADGAGVSVTLAWEPSTDPDVVGYNLYYRVASQTYTNRIQVGNVTNATISGLVPGTTYFFAATATDSAGLESEFSNEVTYTVKPVLVVTADNVSRPYGAANVTLGAGERQPDGNFKITGWAVPNQTYLIAGSTDLAHWTTLGTSVADGNGLIQFVDLQATNHPLRFYRTATP